MGQVFPGRNIFVSAGSGKKIMSNQPGAALLRTAVSTENTHIVQDKVKLGSLAPSHPNPVTSQGYQSPWMATRVLGRIFLFTRVYTTGHVIMS